MPESKGSTPSWCCSFLLSSRKETDGKWGPGTYADFNRDFPWGGLGRKEGEAYLDETLGELAGKGCLSRDEAPIELTAGKLMDRFGFWRGKSRNKYLGRQFRKLEELGLLSFDPTRANTVIGVSELSTPSGEIEPSSYIHPTDDRKSFPSGLRESIFEKDGGQCSYCGIALKKEGPFDIDHIIPLYLNGARLDERNLATSCPKCNSERKWFKFTTSASKSDVWLTKKPRHWRQGCVASISEATIVENEQERRIPVITCDETE